MTRLFGMVPYRTGVDQHDIGVLDVIGQGVPGIGQGRGHQGTVQLVHLAAEALDMDFWIIHRGGRISYPTGLCNDD